MSPFQYLHWVDSQAHLGIMVFQTRKVLPILHYAFTYLYSHQHCVYNLTWFLCSLVLFCSFIYHESTMSFFHIYLLHIFIEQYWLLH